MIQIDTGNTKGITRKVDKINRIVIPTEFLKAIGVTTEVEIYLVEEGIFIRKPE